MEEDEVWGLLASCIFDYGPEGFLFQDFFALEAIQTENWYMERALELAMKGAGKTSPNPLVGAVIVKDGRIIGEGYHEVYGGPHAEVNAVASATEDVEGSTIYVTLEPCSHYGKTPPCAELLVRKKFRKVVIAMTDPNPLVSGRGIAMLLDAGIEVVTGVLEAEARRQNEIFLKYIQTRRPFVIMKTAMTLDGKIATTTGASKWVTGEAAREEVHRLRNRVSAIMVGVNTVLRDDPSLTTRLPDGGTDPVRIIVDSTLRIPLDAKILTLDSPKKTVVATTKRADREKLDALASMDNVEVITVPEKDSRVDLSWLMGWLGECRIDSVLVEGGSELNFSMLEEGLVDKVVTFIAPKLFGGREAKTPVGGEGFAKVEDAVLLQDIRMETFGDDIMVEGYVRKGR
jgi:diaminohydroxyphosphoribosylaminopyrimidine deaminase/5-amino-6-(5-phosphoribosylamino)uracil reductase